MSVLAAILMVLGILALYSCLLHFEIGYVEPPRCLICAAQWLWRHRRGYR